jgi:hypothetical protein
LFVKEVTFCFTLVSITFIEENFLRSIVKIYYLRYKVQAFLPVSWICFLFNAVPDPDADPDQDPDADPDQYPEADLEQDPTLSHCF